MFSFFKKKDYVFLVKQNCIIGDETEKQLRAAVLSYATDSLGKTKKKIEYVDHYASEQSLEAFWFMTTFIPHTTRKFTPLLYEIYAFVKTGDESIFNTYRTEKKMFDNGRQTMTVYKIQL